MKPTEQQLIDALREHGYKSVLHRYKWYVRAPQIRELCYKHHIGGLPEYQYPSVLKKHLSEGMTAEQIGQLYGAAESNVYRWINKHKLPLIQKMYTAADDNYIRFNVGYIPVSEIAATLGRTEHAIYTRMQTLGVKVNSALGYTVQQLSQDIGVSCTTIRAWMRIEGLRRGDATGTYRISVDETYLYEWLMQGNIYRLPPIDPRQYMLMEIKRHCDQEFVSSSEIARFIGKWVCSAKVRFPQKLFTVQGYGAFYLRSAVWEYFWTKRRLLDIEKIPADLPDWRRLCKQWDELYIYREEIYRHLEYSSHGSWFSHAERRKGFPAPVNVDKIKYYSRAAVLEWSRKNPECKSLTQYLESTL